MEPISDGSVVVGATDLPPNGPITVPGHAFRWTQAGGMQDLGSLGAGLGSGATAVSADGSVVVGIATVSGGGTHAFRWTSQAECRIWVQFRDLNGRRQLP